MKLQQVQLQHHPLTFDLNAVDLFPMDGNDDVLLNFLNVNLDLDNAIQHAQQANTPSISEINVTPNVQNVQNVQNFATNLPSVIPKMYFPGSNVTINYNFHSK